MANPNDPYQQPEPYKAKKAQGALPEYDAMRSRLGQRVNADTQQQQDAMQRRFASQGGLNTGAAIKQQQLVAEAGVQNREQGLQEIAGQESAEQRRINEAESNKEFQSREAAAGRSFQASESKLGRDQQQGQFDSNQAFTDKWNTINQSNVIRQLDIAAQESAFNQASETAKMSDDERRWLKYAKGGQFDSESAGAAVAKEKADAMRDRKSRNVFAGLW